SSRANLHSLAFRAFAQNRSYWPDSTPTAFDKRNVRDGHYPLWSYVQYLAPADSYGRALNPNAQLIIDMLAGSIVTTTPPFEPLDVEIADGLIPACAMKVARSSEGGPQSPMMPLQPCGCYYEARVPMGSPRCAVCVNDSTCNGGKCRHGFCEAH